MRPIPPPRPSPVKRGREGPARRSTVVRSRTMEREGGGRPRSPPFNANGGGGCRGGGGGPGAGRRPRSPPFNANGGGGCRGSADGDGSSARGRGRGCAARPLV